MQAGKHRDPSDDSPSVKEILTPRLREAFCGNKYGHWAEFLSVDGLLQLLGEVDRFGRAFEEAERASGSRLGIFFANKHVATPRMEIAVRALAGFPFRRGHEDCALWREYDRPALPAFTGTFRYDIARRPLLQNWVPYLDESQLRNLLAMVGEYAMRAVPFAVRDLFTGEANPYLDPRFDTSDALEHVMQASLRALTQLYAREERKPRPATMIDLPPRYPRRIRRAIYAGLLFES